MRMAYVTASFPYGEGESFLIPEIEAYRAHGVEVIVAPLYARGARRTDWTGDGAGLTVVATGLFSRGVLGACLIELASHPAQVLRCMSSLVRRPWRHALKNAAVLPKGLWLARQVARWRCEHLHVHWAGTTATAGMVAASVAKVPWSLSCHRWDIYENNCLSEKVRSTVFTRFISARGMKDAVARGAIREKCEVIPLGTLPPKSLSSPPWPVDGDFNLLCPANLIPVKGHRYLLEAVRALDDSGLKVHLLIAGEGPLRAELEAHVVRLRVQDRVSFSGQLPHADILRLYASGRVHATVLASVDLGGGHHEGVPVSLMEAMAYGVPVVATRTGSIDELLPSELGLTVPDKDPASLAAAIRRLLANQAHYRRIALLCRELVLARWDVRRSVEVLLVKMQRKPLVGGQPG